MTWEFKTVDRTPDMVDLAQWLFEVNDEGWQLVTFRSDPNGRVVSLDLKRQTP